MLILRVAFQCDGQFLVSHAFFDDGLHVFQGYKGGDAFNCKNAGKIHSRNGVNNLSYRYADDDTTRLLVSGAGATSGVLKIRFKPPTSDQCLGMDITIPLTQPSSSAGSSDIGKWLDSANIQTTIYPGTYKINSGNSKQFISQAGNQGSCKDTLVITGNDDALGTPITIYDHR